MNSVSYQCKELWNDLPSFLRSIDNSDTFNILGYLRLTIETYILVLTLRALNEEFDGYQIRLPWVPLSFEKKNYVVFVQSSILSLLFHHVNLICVSNVLSLIESMKEIMIDGNTPTLCKINLLP